MDNEVKKLYSALISKGYTTKNLGDEQTFISKMQDAENRKQLYDWVNGRGDFRIGSYEDYEKRLTAPPAPKAEEINPTEDKRGYTFTAEELDEKLPRENWGAESIASPRLPEIKPMEVALQSPYKTNYEQAKAAGDTRSYEEWLESLPKAYNQEDVVGVNGELKAFIPKEKIKSEEYGGLSREQAEFLRTIGHNDDVDAVKALNKTTVRDQVNESFQEITDAWNTVRGNVNEEYYGDRWYGKPLQAINKAFFNTDATDFTTDKGVQSLRAADKLIGEAKSVMDAATEGREFFAGTGEALSQWNPVKSLEGLVDADAIEAVVSKIEQGKELSRAESALLDAFALNAAAHTYYEDEVSNWYNAGKVVGDMIPLAAEMAVNPASGMARKWAQATLKRVAGKSLSKATKKALIYAAGAGGAFAGGATMAGTTGLPSVLEEAQKNTTGQALFGINKSGEVGFTGVKEGGSFGEEFLKSLYRRGVENATEQMGAEWLTKWLGGVAGKAIPGGKKAVEYVTDLVDNKYAHYLKELAEKVNYQGPIEEFVEEIESAVLGVPVDGMDSLKEFFDGDNLITTAIAVSVPGFGMGAINAIGGVAKGKYKVGYKENQKRMQAFGRGMEAFGDNQREWSNIAFKINTSSVDAVEEELKRIYHSPDYTDEQKQRVLEYAVHSLKYRTLVEAKTAMTDDTTKMLNDMLGSRYSEGYEVADEQKGAVKQAYDMERERVLNTLGEEVVAQLDNDPVGALETMNEVDRQEAIDYVNARTAYEGMIDRISDDIDERIKASDKEIESHANRQDGAIHPATMRGVNGGAPRKVYIVSGNVATREDGTIDKANSSSMIIVRDAETGEVSAASADDLESLEAVIDTEAEKKSVAEQIANEYAGQQAAIIEAESGKALQTENGEVKTENEAEPVGKTEQLSNGLSNAEQLPKEKQAPAPIPMEKRGKEERAAYHLVPIERIMEDLHDGTLEPDEIVGLIDARIKEAENDVKNVEKKKPVIGADKNAYVAAKQQWQADMEAAKAKLDYYNQLKAINAEATRSEMREAVEAVEPQVLIEQTPDEFVANQLGGIKITPESFQKETGLKAEQKQMVGVIAGKDKGGVTVEQAAEIILENYGDELRGLGFNGDMQDMRDMIINILSNGNPRSYAKKGAEMRAQESVEQQRSELESVAHGLNFNSIEDEEAVVPRIIQDYTGFDEQEYFNNLAENYEYDTTREGEGTRGGSELLQGEQAADNAGVGDITESGQGGEIQGDVYSGGENAAPQGNQQVSSSEIPNNQNRDNVSPVEGAAEGGNAPGQSGVAEIKESTFTEEVLENGDKRITNYNSRGEVEAVATEQPKQETVNRRRIEANLKQMRAADGDAMMGVEQKSEAVLAAAERIKKFADEITPEELAEVEAMEAKYKPEEKYVDPNELSEVFIPRPIERNNTNEMEPPIVRARNKDGKIMIYYVDMDMEVGKHNINGNETYPPLEVLYDEYGEKFLKEHNIDPAVLPAPGKYRLLGYNNLGFYIDFNGGEYFIPGFGAPGQVRQMIEQGNYRGLRADAMTVESAQKAEAPVTSETTESESKQEVEKIEDVGEKIGGAKKDRFAEGMARIKAELEETDETLMDKLTKLPVSQVFNFDLEKLREGGISNEAISFIKIVKDYLPAKPRKTYKIRSWVNNTLALYKLCLEAGTNWARVNTLLNGPQFTSSSLKEQFDAYMAIGGFDSGMNIGNAKLRQLDKTSGRYDESGKFVTLGGKWYVRDAGKHGGIYDTKEEAVNALKAFAGDKAGVTSSGKKKEVKFAVYQRRQDKSIFIAVKGKSDIVIQDGFKSSKEAFDYIEANNAELQERYRALLDKTNADFEDNRPREGRDYRDGKDIPAEEFRTTFGFRGVEFGNWMTQEDRRKALNECYDALMDLAAVCKVSPQALSLGGTLGMAFGARGGGRFSAHYEPGKLVINLTKTKGAGSLAHEWFHALDNYFAKMGSEGLDVYATAGEGLFPEGISSIGKRYYDRKSGQMLTEEEYNERMNSHEVRREMANAWKSLMETLKKSDYYKRSAAYAGLHNSKYWARPTELGARAFSTWVENELSKQGASNDYLANNPRFLVSEATDEQSRFMPYPFDADATWMEEAFGNLFEVMQEKTTEDGKAVLYSIAEDAMLKDKGTEAFERATKVTMEAAERLKVNGLDIEVVSQEEADAMDANRVSPLRTTDGKVYGWTVDGKIRLTPDGINPDTPVHEYAHLWGADVEKNNPKLWNKVVEAMKLSPVWNEVANDANYSDIHGNDSRMASEVLARLSGGENYRRTMEQAEKEIANANGVFEMAEMISSWAKVKGALKSFWNWVQRNVFHTEPMDWQDFVDDVVGRYYGVSKAQRLKQRVGDLTRDILNAVFDKAGIEINLAEPAEVEQVAVSLSSVGEPTAPLGQRSSAESGELQGEKQTAESGEVQGEPVQARNRNMDREAWKKAFKKGGEKAYDLMYELHGGIVSTYPQEFLAYLKEVIGVADDVANIIEGAHDYLIADFKKKNPELFKRNESEKVEDVHSLLATKGYSLLEHTMDNGKAIGVKMMYRDKFVPSGKTDASYTPGTEEHGRTVICYYNHPEARLQNQYVFTVTKNNAMETPTAYELVADPSLMTPEWAEYLEKIGRKNADGTFFLDGLVPNFNDPFSLSHLMIRVNKNSHDVETISRYNHGAFNEKGEYERIVGQPNATLNNDLDKLVDGLSESLMEYKQLETIGAVPLGENMIVANDGKIYRYNDIKGGVHVGDGFWVDRRGDAHVINPGKEKLVGEFLYGGGKVKNVANGESVDIHGLKFTENGVEFYTGGEEVTETREIEIKGEKKAVTKKVIKGDAKNVITFDGDKTRLETESVDAETINRVGKLYDVYSIKGDNLIDAGNGFLDDFFWVRRIDFPNLETAGSNCFNATLTSANLPKLREVGVNCFNRVTGVNVMPLPSLEKVGANFMYSVGTMGEDVNIDFPKLREVGNFFMKNAQPSVVSLPSLETCGEGFMKGSMRGVTVDLPNLTKAGWEFFGGGRSVQSLNAPKLTDVKNDFMEGNQEIRQQILEQTGKEFVAIEDVERIDVEDSAYELKDGTVVDAKHVSVKFPEGVTFMVVDTNGNVLAGVFAGKKLAEVVGKQYAAEILKPGSFTIEAKEEVRFRKMNEHAEEFNKTHKGGLPVVEINPNNMEAELAEEGFTTEEIDELKKRMKKGAGAFYNPDRNLIYLLDPTLDKERVYSYCWHEDTHVASVSLGVAQELKDEFYSLAQGKKKENLDAFLKALGYEKKDYPEESMAHSVQAMAMLDKWEAGILSKLTGSTAEGAQRQMEIIQPLIDYINNGRQGNQSNLREDVRNGDVYDTASNEASRETEAEGTGETATGGLTESEIALLEASTGYTREEIIDMFGYDLNREGAGPLTDREVVMESDVYSKVLGKPRYYGKKQREYVARQRRRMADKARQVAEKLNLDNVEVLESTEGLTGKKATSKGWFDPRTGKITVVVPNHGSTGDIVETVLHEAVAHYGLRKLFGENFKNFLDNVYRNVTPEIRAEITELAKKHGWDFHTATEEYLASLAENTNFERVNPSVWSNIKSFFMKMLSKVGITLDEPLGDNELRYILWRSHQNLVNPGWFNVFGQAEDIAKQYELGVGNYQGESGKRKAESGDVAAEDDLRFREGGAPGSAREEYERKVRRPNKSGSVGATENVARRAQEAYQDSMLALKILQDAVAKETGNEVKDNENAYIAENRMSSSNKAMVEIYERDFFMPLMDEINALIKEGVEYDDIIRYLHAKHGLERNEYMRRKQAEEAARRELGEEPAMPNEGDADYEAKVNAKAAWRANLAELTESYVKKFAKRDYSGLTALTETANAKDAEAAAQQMVDEFENDHDTTPLWEAVNKATKETLRREFVGGLIDRATYDTVSTMFDFYIPLRGWDENVAANEYEYFTNNNTPVFTPAIKTMHGRKSLSDDPIATIGYMAGSAIARANRNLMKQKFLNFVMNNPTSLATVSEQWYTMDYGTNEWVPNNPAIPEDATPEQVVEIVEAHEANMRALEKAGKATRERSGLKIGLHATKQEQQQHVVRVMRNGKEYAVYINGNPRAAQALNGMTNPDVSKSKAREAAQAVKNFMARAFTSRNPAFIISNSVRDVIWAGTAVAAKEDAEYAKQYTKNVVGVLAKFKLPRLLRKFSNGTLDMNNEIERYFDEFLRNGGETGFTQVLTVDDYKKNIKRFTEEAKNGARISKKAWRGFWNGVEFLNRSAEDITRFTVYMTSRQMGRSIARSVYDAKEITVNFNKKGSGEMGAKYLNFAYIFFNATMQSLANFGKLMARHPGKMAAAIGTFGMLGFLMPVINAALMALGDDDDEEYYWNLPEWVRRNNIVLFVPWTEKGFITIPLPHEIRPFYGMGENAMSALQGKQSTKDAIKKSLVGFTGMLPIDFTANGGDVVVNVMPTILQPLAQVRANVTHFGTPIYKDNDFNKRYPSWTKAYKGTNSTLVAATKWLNELGGGNDVDSGGLLDWNPAVIEHLFESYLGGMGKTFNKTATTFSMLWDEDARIARNIPVASSFYQEGDERTAGSQLNREYFDALEEMDGFQHRMSGYQKEITKGNAEYEKLFEDLVNSNEFMRYGIIKDYSNAISELNLVLKNNNPTEEKAQEIEGVIQELKNEMLDELEKL